MLHDERLRIMRKKHPIERKNLSRWMYPLISSDHAFPRKIHLSARSISFPESEFNVIGGQYGRI